MSPLPRILMTSGKPPPPGGIGSVVETILESELRERYEFVRFTTSVRRLGPGWFRYVANTALSRGLGLDSALNLEALATLRAFAATLPSRPALVHIHTSHGYDFWLGARMARIARRHGIPTLLHLHGLFDVVVPTWSRARQALFRLALQQPDRVVVLSEGWQRWFSKYVDERRLEVLRNPVDVRRFRVDAARPPSDRVQLLFVGTRDPVRKGAYEILTAARSIVAQAPHLRFVMVGEDVEQLEARCVRGTPLEAHFEFVGSKNTAEIAPYFEQADVLLLPSHSEGLPIALLEGMAAGLPVIACPVNGIPEAMSDPGNGLLVPPRDPDALAAAILALARDPGRRRAIGLANRRKAEQEFDRSHYARALGAIYERALSGASR